MSYTPKLTDAFYLAMSGDTAAQGAGGRPITSAVQTTYAREINAAFAFAQEFDTQWGDTPPDPAAIKPIFAAALAAIAESRASLIRTF
jgi:hypothetical protein